MLEILDIKFDEISAENKKKIEDSALMSAIEYGRIVHAEMCALTDAARLGRPVADAYLFSTTFPCHLCAKHIVASGVKEVCFLEPYPKSLAAVLHSDSIKIEGVGRGRYSGFPSVRFFHFHGITPRRYGELFRRGKRKDKQSRFKKWRDSFPRPIFKVKVPFYFALEKFVLRSIEGAIRDEKLKKKLLPKNIMT